MLSNFFLILFTLTFCGKKKASCSDGLLNQGEIRTDCGGPCSPCATCSDGIQNQDEVKIDCGGICSACQTCSDGIQNQGETAIDCGGPCGKCAIKYPENGLYGKSLLAFSKYDTTLVPGKYSLAAELPVSTKLRVVFSNPPGGTINYGYALGSGNWQVVNSQDRLTQSFVITGSASADQQIIIGDAFFGRTGDAKMEIYENDDVQPTWVKYLRWK